MIKVVPLVVIVITILIYIIVGIYLRKHAKSRLSFMVAGRSMGPAFGTLMVFAAFLSVVSFAGGIGAVFDKGIGFVGWMGYLLIIGMLIGGYLIAPQMRKTAVFSVAEYTGTLFGDKAKYTSSIVITITSWLYLIPQILVFGLVLHWGTGVPIPIGCLIGGLVYVIYIYVAGMYGIAFSDFLEVIFYLEPLYLR